MFQLRDPMILAFIVPRQLLFRSYHVGLLSSAFSSPASHRNCLSSSDTSASPSLFRLLFWFRVSRRADPEASLAVRPDSYAAGEIYRG